MKRIYLYFLGLVCFASLAVSCVGVRVTTDYDSMVNFTEKKTYAFYKEGVDRVEISDLDKKRIMRSIEQEMSKRGFVMTGENPDMLVNFFTREDVRNDVYNNMGVGFGWGPFYMYRGFVMRETEGTLFIDILDGTKKDLIWQGKGVGILSERNKDEVIYDFVSNILKSFPPNKAKK